LSAGALPQTPLGELITALPQTPSWILGGLLLRGRERDERGREGRVRAGRGREGRRGERERGRRGKDRDGEGRRQGRPRAKTWPHQNYFPGAGAALTCSLSLSLSSSRGW